MSYTTLYTITAPSLYKEIAELRNAHGWCPRIWGVICKRFLGDECEWLTGDANKLWALWKDPCLDLHYRVALASTYDYAIISKETAKEVASLLRKFSDEAFPNPNYVNHLPAIATHLESLPDCTGLCFRGTSCGDNVWFTYSEKTDREVPYNLKRGNRHFFVLETVKDV